MSKLNLRLHPVRAFRPYRRPRVDFMPIPDPGPEGIFTATFNVNYYNQDLLHEIVRQFGVPKHIFRGAPPVDDRERLYKLAEPFLLGVVECYTTTPGCMDARLAFADWLREQGLEDEAAGQLWAAKHGKYPTLHSNRITGGWSTEDNLAYQTHSKLPALFIGNEAYDLVITPIDQVEAEKAYLRRSGQLLWDADGEPYERTPAELARRTIGTAMVRDKYPGHTFRRLDQDPPIQAGDPFHYQVVCPKCHDPEMARALFGFEPGDKPRRFVLPTAMLRMTQDHDYYAYAGPCDNCKTLWVSNPAKTREIGSLNG